MRFLFFIFFLGVHLSWGQKVKLILKHKTPLQADRFVGIDEYGSVYYVSNNQLFKKSKKETFHFSDLQLGELSQVDIINPLKLVLFYKHTQKVVFVDQHLVEIATIPLSTPHEIRNFNFVRMANGNKLWAFNVEAQAVELFDYVQRKVVAHSFPVLSAVQHADANFNFCWLYIKNEGLVCYNTYGARVRQVQTPELLDWDESNGRILAKTGEGLIFLPKKSHTFVPLFLAETPKIKAIYLAHNLLYIYDGKWVYTYDIVLKEQN